MTTDNSPIAFGLKSIRTDEFATVPYLPGDDQEIALSTGLNFEVYTDRYEIAVLFRASFEAETKPFIILQIACVFDVKPEDFKKFLNKENAVDVRKDFLAHLAVLTIGTARGVLHSKLENTSFSNQFILPVINVTDIAIRDTPIASTTR